MDYRAHPSIALAARAMHGGRVVAYPTEAVWGLGANPFNERAVDTILELKNRAREKGLILVAANVSQFDFLLQNLPSDKLELLASSWPGPHTWLVPHHNLIPAWVCGQFDTVALRVSAHPVVKALCEAFGGAIVSTSANPQGLAPARYGFKARLYFGSSVEYCAGQVNHHAQPSQIRDLSSGQLVRA